MNNYFHQTMKKRHKLYLELLNKLGEPVGKIEKGETQIETNPEKFLQIENELRQNYEKKGMDPDSGNVGVFFQNPWYVFMNEPVYFPSKKKEEEKIPGAYLRVLFRGEAEGERSAFCLPLLKNGNFLLTLSYRTTVRSWVVEAPGTVAKKGEKMDDALQRCIKEKLGREILKKESLSESGLISERGIMGAAVPAFLVTVCDEQKHEIKDLNVREVIEISLKELKGGFLKGYIEIKKRKCLCQDSYTAFALLMLSLRDDKRINNT